MTRALARALALALALSIPLGAPLPASARRRTAKKPASPEPSPSPSAAASPKSADERHAAVRAAMDAFDLDRARKLATQGMTNKQVSADRDTTVLLGEIDILADHLPEAAKRLGKLAAADRRANWLVTLIALAGGDAKASARLHELAAGTKPGEEAFAELGWLLEGALPGHPTTRAEQLAEQARTELDAHWKPGAALALHACARIGNQTESLQVLVDRLHQPSAPAGK